MNNDSIIKCPNCDTEYLPGEIYLPKYFVGQPEVVERDFEGKILWEEGIHQDTKETFICEKCGKRFSVKATIKYETTLDKRLDTDEEYVSEKYKNRIYLEEN